MNPDRFRQFLAIDWSGAAGERQSGIALALADAAGGPPVLIDRGGSWSRSEVLAILTDLPRNTLVGMDLGLSLPFADCGAYFPGWPQSPQDAVGLWQLVDSLCDDLNLGASSFVDHPQLANYFRRHGAREGEFFRCDGAAHGRGRFRVTELAQGELGCKPYSNFNLVGAAQVGKSSLTGMRLLNRLRGTIAVWPIDPLPPEGSVIVEIYTTIAAMAAGRSASRAKIRDRGELDKALAALGSPPIGGTGPIDDHSADALISATWLRNNAARPELWQPNAMSAEIARTEGWTFGAA